MTPGEQATTGGASRFARALGIVLALAAALLVVAAAAIVALGVSRVHGISMRPVLQDGDLVLANPLNHTPQRFDLALYEPPGGNPAVKRVIGLPGDRVRITRDPGSTVQVQVGGTGPWQAVTVDGRAWPVAPHAATPCCTPDGRIAQAPQGALVPRDAYFLLGDNATASIDSRSHGFVTTDALRATVVRAPLFGATPATPRLTAAE